MILSFSALHAIRMSVATVAIGGLVLTAGHAIAKNHDLQPFTSFQAFHNLHDHAPGPGTRTPQ